MGGEREGGVEDNSLVGISPRNLHKEKAGQRGDRKRRLFPQVFPAAAAAAPPPQDEETAFVFVFVCLLLWVRMCTN